MSLELTHDKPMGLDLYPSTIGGGFVWLGIGCEFGECDYRLAIMKTRGGATDDERGAPFWVVSTGHLSAADGNVELKVDADGSKYHRYSLVISNITNEATKDFGDRAPDGSVIKRPSKWGEPYCGIMVTASVQPDSKIA